MQTPKQLEREQKDIGKGKANMISGMNGIQVLRRASPLCYVTDLERQIRGSLHRCKVLPSRNVSSGSSDVEVAVL